MPRLWPHGRRTLTQRRIRSLLALALAAGVAFVSAPARADDPKPASPPPERKPIPKIENALLDGFVGSWDVAMKGFGTEGKGLSRVRKVAGGTSILQETQVVTPDRTAFAASVFRVTDGGKGVKVWRIDTLMYRDLGAFSGTLSADGLEASSDMGTQMGLKRVGEAYEATGSRGDSVVFTSTCTKAAKEVVLDTPNALAKGLAPALVGDWQVAGEWTLPGKDGKPATIQVTGTSKYEWALGGGALLHHYERTTPMGAVHALGILRPADDGSSMKVWWFDTMQVDPLLAEGAVTESAWHGKGKTADGGTMGLELSKKGDAFEMRLELDGKPVGSETFTRKR